MSKKSKHVVARSGQWSVKSTDSARAIKVFGSQAKAVSYGRELAKTQKTDLFIHGRDGRVLSKDSYGKDPVPPKAKKK